jgi:dihydrofolate reductase
MTNKVFIATSLDGYIADKNGGIDWLNEYPSPSGSDGGFSEFMNSIDAVIMGRTTFEKVLSFNIPWPYEKKVFVLSTTLKKMENELIDKVEIIDGDLEIILKKLEKNSYKNLYVDGGKTIQSFLSKNLIDELIITQAPVILGGGIPLFSDIPRINLKLLSVKPLDNGMVQSHYRVLK